MEKLSQNHESTLQLAIPPFADSSERSHGPEYQLGQTMLMKDKIMGHMENGIRTTTMVSMMRNARWLTFLKMVRISLTCRVNYDRENYKVIGAYSAAKMTNPAKAASAMRPSLFFWTREMSIASTIIGK